MPSVLKDRCLHLLQYPGSADLSIDSPETTIKRWQIIREKPFLRRIYEEWYRELAEALPNGNKPALEIGSGAGFMSDFVSDLITSDILKLPNLAMVLDACKTFPFEPESLRGIAMVNTLHHLPDVSVFFEQASRCLEPGGVITMLEPWTTSWSQFVYQNLHHEPFDPKSSTWRFKSSGPLSSANGALPWILFARDRATFEKRFSNLELLKVRLTMPLRYLLSGGVSMRALVPAWTFTPFSLLENMLEPCMGLVAMFAQITLRRRTEHD
jgi:SAM-dependent methyltransferase